MLERGFGNNGGIVDDLPHPMPVVDLVGVGVEVLELLDVAGPRNEQHETVRHATVQVAESLESVRHEVSHAELLAERDELWYRPAEVHVLLCDAGQDQEIVLKAPHPDACLLGLVAHRDEVPTHGVQGRANPHDGFERAINFGHVEVLSRWPLPAMVPVSVHDDGFEIERHGDILLHYLLLASIPAEAVEHSIQHKSIYSKSLSISDLKRSDENF